MTFPRTEFMMWLSRFERLRKFAWRIFYELISPRLTTKDGFDLLDWGLADPAAPLEPSIL